MKASKIVLIVLAMIIGASGVTALIRHVVGYYALEHHKKSN